MLIFCIQKTHLEMVGIYRQDECLVMGSPLLPTISNMNIEYMEEIALESTPLKPPPWMKYINDTFLH